MIDPKNSAKIESWRKFIMDWKQLIAASDVLKMRFADKDIKYEDETGTMWEIKIDLGDTAVPILLHEFLLSSIIFLNGKDKESGQDAQKVATAKQQKQVEEHVAKAITRLLDEDHGTVAQNNKSMKGWKGKNASNPSANSNASLTQDCNKLKNYMKLKDQLQKVQDDPIVKNALQKHNGSQRAKAATVEKKVKGAQTPVQKKLLELAKQQTSLNLKWKKEC
ncbi:hypothetical protein BC830DRAFT_1179435 [Chytriomyces sp. MP71]|nr:hypothetical protein BC830DRAFT_1179435 [Chytriomyces sp. MP71]